MRNFIYKSIKYTEIIYIRELLTFRMLYVLFRLFKRINRQGWWLMKKN